MNRSRPLTLVCNSHIDPVWLWPWEEGLAVTLATFRAAASFCEETDGFVFCHNEALLYAWVETHEPALFQRIRSLVACGRWHVMGGWFLQPDCNLPGGESLVRQILVGRTYFRERFGVEPTVAVNLDPFGHTRGLVQILAKSGYRGYLFCRPDAAWLDLPDDSFTWVGYDGSTVVAHRASEHYNSELGKAAAKVEKHLAAHPGEADGLLLWGVGNHGGGPSREDLRAIAALAARTSDRSIEHGTPEAFFDRLAGRAPLPRVERDLNPWAVGCYTSMATVKQAHARLERLLFAVESMMANAAIDRRLDYPAADLRSALEDLLFCQFHDILPGEGTREVEQQALQRLGHGLEVAGRLRARAFFSALAGHAPAAPGEYPIFILNHHPFAVSDTVTCEFEPPEPNFDKAVRWQPVLTDADGRAIPVQVEKESCNIQNDHRKRLVFDASLPAATMSRFSCRLVERPVADMARAASVEPDRSGRVLVSPATGRLEALAAEGVNCLRPEGCRLLLFEDSADPWGMKVKAFRRLAGEFALLSPAESASLAGVSCPELAAVRVIEAGPVRTVTEALVGCGRSAASIRYKVHAGGDEVELEIRVAWFERDRMLKLAIPTTLGGGRVLVETAYGVETVTREGEELCAHRWLALVDAAERTALTVISESTYGFDVADGEIRLSLLRAPAYAGHPVDDVTPIVRQDRWEPREDQGEHVFRFWLKVGPARERLEAVSREAVVRTAGVLALNAFPSGDGRPLVPGVSLSDPVVSLAALKLSKDGLALVVRLFEPTGCARATTVSVPALGLSIPVSLQPFELRTLRVDLATHAVETTDLLERPMDTGQ